MLCNYAEFKYGGKWILSWLVIYATWNVLLLLKASLSLWIKDKGQGAMWKYVQEKSLLKEVCCTGKASDFQKRYVRNLQSDFWCLLVNESCSVRVGKWSALGFVQGFVSCIPWSAERHGTSFTVINNLLPLFLEHLKL